MLPIIGDWWFGDTKDSRRCRTLSFGKDPAKNGWEKDIKMPNNMSFKGIELTCKTNEMKFQIFFRGKVILKIVHVMFYLSENLYEFIPLWLWMLIQCTVADFVLKFSLNMCSHEKCCSIKFWGGGVLGLHSCFSMGLQSMVRTG